MKLLNACRTGNMEVAQEMLREEVYINTWNKEEEGRTPLQYAAREGHVDIVKMLIENDAKVNATDFNDCTALHHAARGGHVDVVKVLIQNGADVNAVQHFTSQL